MNKPSTDLSRNAQTSESRDLCHELWLIYSELKDAESDPLRRLELLERSREKLGQIVNKLNRQLNQHLSAAFSTSAANDPEPKSPRYQAARTNCRDRQFNLTPDNARAVFGKNQRIDNAQLGLD